MSEPNEYQPTDSGTRKRSPDEVRDQEIQAQLPPGVPARIARFEIRRVLGQGGFGTVYLAFDTNLNREVALKVPIGLTTPASREEFLREARAAAGIHHQNVCQVFDAEIAGNVPFIVSRYVGGGTLADLLKRANGALSPDTAIKIVRKIALGLAAAHARGIVHRDLKPGNVLFDDENNEILITDFGLAKLLAHANQSSGGVKGTPAYMSPEQCGDGRRAGEVGLLSDIYSLGVILYELLTGEPPFGGPPLPVMMAHVMDTPDPPSSRRHGLDARLDAMCLKALAKAPADRYVSAKDFAKALTGFLRIEKVVESKPQIQTSPLSPLLLQGTVLPPTALRETVDGPSSPVSNEIVDSGDMTRSVADVPKPKAQIEAEYRNLQLLNHRWPVAEIEEQPISAPTGTDILPESSVVRFRPLPSRVLICLSAIFISTMPLLGILLGATICVSVSARELDKWWSLTASFQMQPYLTWAIITTCAGGSLIAFVFVIVERFFASPLPVKATVSTISYIRYMYNLNFDMEKPVNERRLWVSVTPLLIVVCIILLAMLQIVGLIVILMIWLIVRSFAIHALGMDIPNWFDTCFGWCACLAFIPGYIFISEVKSPFARTPDPV